MAASNPNLPLSGAKALVIGIANDSSIAYGCAKAFRELVDIMDVGRACAYLATPQARRITGGTFYIDAGMNTMA